MEEVKAFSIRVSKEMWLFLKHRAADIEMTMNDIINKSLEDYKKKVEKKS